jgi:hypothetical protein
MSKYPSTVTATSAVDRPQTLEDAPSDPAHIGVLITDTMCAKRSISSVELILCMMAWCSPMASPEAGRRRP